MSQVEVVPNPRFFDFINQHFAGLSHPRTIHRFFTYMRSMGAQSIIREHLHGNALDETYWQEEIEAIEARLNFRPLFELSKITFSRRSLSELVDLPADDLLGYCTIATLHLPKGRWSYVYDSVVREHGYVHTCDNWFPNPAHFLHVQRLFKCSYGGLGSYEIAGNYFRQQNGITNVCAHACAVIMLNNIPSVRAFVTAESVNKILEFDHRKKKFSISHLTQLADSATKRGLSTKQLAEVFLEHGFHSKRHHYDTAKTSDKNSTYQDPKEFRAFLYSHIESGFPALFTFMPNKSEPKIHHVAAVMGHTLNMHSWLPLARSCKDLNIPSDSYYSPLQWIDDFLIHDETLGIGCTLPSRAFIPGSDPEGHANLVPQEALGLVPNDWNINFPGHFAQDTAAKFLRAKVESDSGAILKRNRYTARLLDKENDSKTLKTNTIFRPILVDIRDYFESLNGTKISPQSKDIMAFVRHYAPHIWLIEVSDRDLYVGNRAKIMDIGIIPTMTPYANNFSTIKSAVLFWRCPDRFYVQNPKSGVVSPFQEWTTPGYLPMFSNAPRADT